MVWIWPVKDIIQHSIKPPQELKNGANNSWSNYNTHAKMPRRSVIFQHHIKSIQLWPWTLMKKKSWVSNKHIWSEMSTTWQHIKRTLKGDYWNDVHVFSWLGLEYGLVHGHVTFKMLKEINLLNLHSTVNSTLSNHVLLIYTRVAQSVWHRKTSDKT